MTDYQVSEYMVTSFDGTNHPGLLARAGSGVIFDGVTQRWVPELGDQARNIPYDEIYRATFLARDQLLATANKYRNKLKQPTLELTTTHNWHEVQESVQATCVGLEKLALNDKDMSGSLGRLKRAFRGLCRNAGVGQTCATLIPNDSFGFTSVLCGSLKVIFAGLRATGIYRQEVYRTLEVLPAQLEDLAANVSLYEHEEEVHVRAAALYAASFRLLNHLLLWFLQRTWLKGAMLLLDPSGFTEKLRDHQADFKMAAQSFGAHLNTLSMRTESAALQLQYTTASTQARMNTQLATLIKFKEELQDRQTQMEVRERSNRVEVLESIRPLLDNIMETLQRREIHEQHHRHVAGFLEADCKKLLNDFLYDPELVERDFDERSLILLNGRAEPRPDSEVSLYAAKIVDRLLEHHRERAKTSDSGAVVIPLAFFCGQHRDWERDDHGSPEELAMSLLLQLVDRGRHHLDPEILQRFSADTTGGDIDSICSMFSHLIGSLGREVIVIMIVDGLRFFAQPKERAHGIEAVVTHLVQVYRREQQAMLKMLFTSPTKSYFVEHLFDEEEKLEMPRDVPAAGMDSSQWLQLNH